MLSNDDEKVKILFANFFGVSPFKIDEDLNIIDQFGADAVDIKELSWILSEEYKTIISEEDVLSVNQVKKVLNEKI